MLPFSFRVDIFSTVLNVRTMKKNKKVFFKKIFMIH